MSKKLKDLSLRSFSGIAFVIILISAIAFSSLTFIFLFLLILVIGMIEFYDMASKVKSFPQKFTGIAIGIILFLLFFLHSISYISIKIFLLFIPLLTLVFISELYRIKKKPFTNIAYTFLGIIYIALPISMLNYFVFDTNIVTAPTANFLNLEIEPMNNFFNNFYFLSTSPIHITYNPNLLLGFFFLVWAFDTGAYLIGTTIGRTRLSKKISPKKSWEGTIGGTIVTFSIAYIISLFYNNITLVNWFIISFIIVIMASFGDLVESLFKRSINVKDSGNILPGHGGILDRFDGILLSAPIVLIYLELL